MRGAVLAEDDGESVIDNGPTGRRQLRFDAQLLDQLTATDFLACRPLRSISWPDTSMSTRTTRSPE